MADVKEKKEKKEKKVCDTPFAQHAASQHTQTHMQLLLQQPPCAPIGGLLTPASQQQC